MTVKELIEKLQNMELEFQSASVVFSDREGDSKSVTSIVQIKGELDNGEFERFVGFV